MGASLSDIDLTSRLGEDAPRAPDHRAEAEAMNMLAEVLGRADGDVLDALASVALEACRAETAGVSILEFDGASQVFRWHAIQGAWAKYQGQGLPRHASPCGETVARGTSVLMRSPQLYYPDVAAADPPIAEVLLSPFKILGESVGTVWVISHSEGRRFDAEDARMTERLASFAANAFVLQDRVRRGDALREELERSNQRLMKILERNHPREVA